MREIGIEWGKDNAYVKRCPKIDRRRSTGECSGLLNCPHWRWNRMTEAFDLTPYFLSPGGVRAHHVRCAYPEPKPEAPPTGCLEKAVVAKEARARLTRNRNYQKDVAHRHCGDCWHRWHIETCPALGGKDPDDGICLNFSHEAEDKSDA